MTRIGFDVDGVLADFHSAFIPLVKKHTGIDVKVGPEGPTTWNYHLDAGVTPAQGRELWNIIKASPDFFMRLKPLSGAIETLRLLDALQGYYHAQTAFITARSGDTAHEQTKRWLRSHGMSDPQVLIVKSADDKAAVAAGLKLDVFVEDKLENAVAAHEKGVPNVFLLDYPYNQGVIAREIMRVSSPLVPLVQMRLTHPAYGLLRPENDGFISADFPYADILGH